MSKLFNGKKVAEQVLSEVKIKVSDLNKKPKLISIVVGDEKGALFYQKLKQKKAAELGIEIEIVHFRENTLAEEIISRIKKENSNENVDGIMLQLPLPEGYSVDDRNVIIESITSVKDVDGMKINSNFTSPVVKSVIKAFKSSVEQLVLDANDLEILVIGHSGFEGSKIYQAFEEMEYRVEGVDKNTEDLSEKTKLADVIVSATGVHNLITKNMVKDGVILIDVGSPKGDIEKSAYEKASFVSPVPGGVGPMTISFLMENILEASINEA